jgi:hypothetical protein
MKTGRFRAILLVLGLGIVAIQLVPITHDNPPPAGALAGAPPEVAGDLRRSCYNCHSHETRWPWYSHVAPISWLVAHDVHEGRRHLNFSAWTSYTPQQRAKKRASISELVQQRDMPQWYYLPLHREARLSDEDVARIAAWADSGE